VEPGEFFQLVGRNDLADRYRSKTRLRNGLWLGGAGLTVASLVGSIVLSSATDASTGVPIGLIGGAAGIGLMFGGFFINTQVAPLHDWYGDGRVSEALRHSLSRTCSWPPWPWREQPHAVVLSALALPDCAQCGQPQPFLPASACAEPSTAWVWCAQAHPLGCCP
jgi:hypothetical protein